MIKQIQTPLNREQINDLKAGDEVLITGTLFAARDASHKRMIQDFENGLPLPFPMEGAVIYYAGPCPAPPGKVIGSAGPTTSGRMDAYAPTLMANGLSGMIGKGTRSRDVVDAMIRYGAVYFGAVGGAGARLAQSIVEEHIIAFPELGAEAVRRLEVKDFPAFVIIDSRGCDMYETGRAEALKVLQEETE